MATRFSIKTEVVKNKTEDQQLKGWNAIASHLGQPVAVAQRWAKSGMPVKREGRYVVASPEELSRWLGRESGTTEVVHIAAAGEDLTTELRRGLAEARRRRKVHRVK